MIKGKLLLSSILLIVVLASCIKDDFDKYERPEWLAGKVYSQIKEVDNLSTFAKCLEISHYDTIINVSGSYTVFAPTNQAFELYFQNHPSYKSVEDIPLNELEELVKYHIVQNPWSRDQLRSLDVNGWIDIDDPFNDKPRGFKRVTLLLEDDMKYGVKNIGINTTNLILVDTTLTQWHRRVLTESRKYAPLFYQEYFNLYNLQLSDYSYYFDRSFDNPNDLFFVNAKVEGDEIFAENGFVYTIDRVVEPLLNANEILRKGSGANQYNKFTDLVNRFVSLTWNEPRTNEQAGAQQGLVVDSLFDLSYPLLAFNIHTEKTKAPSGAGLPDEVTIRFHHGLVAPTNAAFDEFVDQYIKGGSQWGSIEETPKRIQKIIANSYFSANPTYETDIHKGYYNGEQDIVKLNHSDIIQKEFGSNATFLGVNKAIVPRAFSSVTGPVYRQRGYRIMMNAIEFTGLLPALKRAGEDYQLFAVNDATSEADSSLVYTYVDFNNQVFEFFDVFEISEGAFRRRRMDGSNKNWLRILLMNQIAVEKRIGVARKEFSKTMGGNYITWDNEKGTVKGTANSVKGYRGSRIIDITPRLISDNADNGKTYEAQTWFSFTTTELYSVISLDFPGFQSLLLKAGFAKPNEYRYDFVSQNQIYTVFAPSNEALQAISADTLTGANLERFIKLHFIEGAMIFTDGKLNEGYYQTAYTIPAGAGRPSQKAKIYIKPDIDVIQIAGKNNANFMSVNESAATNRITARSLTTETDPIFTNSISTGVVHKIDKAFDFNMLDVN